MTWDNITTMNGNAWRIWLGHFLHDGPDDLTTQFYGSTGCIEVCGVGEWTRMQNLVRTKTGQTTIQNVSDNDLFIMHLEAAQRPPLRIYKP